MRLLLIAFALLALVPAAFAAESPAPASAIPAYTPPPVPGAPDPLNLLLRLLGLTAGLLVLCIVVFLFARRAQRRTGLTKNAAGRLRHEGTLALDRRSAVHLISVDGQAVAVTTDASGLRSIVVLSEPFEQELQQAQQREAA
jgi:hypothetical protein